MRVIKQINQLNIFSKWLEKKFTVDGTNPAEIASQLAARGIGIGNGNCYAYRLMEALSIDPEQGVARLSFVHYTNKEEMDRLLESLDTIL